MRSRRGGSDDALSSYAGLTRVSINQKNFANWDGLLSQARHNATVFVIARSEATKQSSSSMRRKSNSQIYRVLQSCANARFVIFIDRIGDYRFCQS
jgi:hypothetical protein